MTATASTEKNFLAAKFRALGFRRSKQQSHAICSIYASATSDYVLTVWRDGYWEAYHVERGVTFNGRGEAAFSQWWDHITGRNVG